MSSCRATNAKEVAHLPHERPFCSVACNADYVAERVVLCEGCGHPLGDMGYCDLCDDEGQE